MSWSRLAGFVRRHPWRVLSLSLLALVPPAMITTHTRMTYNVLRELPPSAESVRGYQALSGHFSTGDLTPVIVVVRAKQSLWDDKTFRALNDLTVAIGKVPGVEIVRSITQPTGGVFTEADLKEGGLEGFASFPDRLEEGASGTGRVIDGLTRIRAGLDEMRAKLPALRSGLSEGAKGIEKIRDGIRAMIDGLTKAVDALDKPGASNDLADLVGAAATHIKSAFDKITADPFTVADANLQAAAMDAGRAYAELTGRDPQNPDQPAHDPTNPSNDDDIKRLYDAHGVEGSLRSVAKGLRQAVAGLRQMDDGLARLGPGLQDGSIGVGKTIEGIKAMVAGLDQIIPGLGRLRAGLAAGAATVRSAGFGDIASAGNLGLTPSLISSVPGLEDRLKFFISGDRRTTRLFVTLQREPYHATSLSAVTEIRRTGSQALNKTPIEGAPVLVAGSAAFFDDIRSLSSADLPVIIVAVLIGIFIVLALLLRSLVAPAYLILTVLLSLLATLGLTTLVFQGIFGHPGVAWWLPPFLFVMLVALGADYNIFLMSRIREEARTRTTADATAHGLALTGHVITSAGLILAGTFAALMFAPLRSMQQFGFAVAVGILLDTFVVRSLLVPSIATILGRHNWWPSRRAWAK